MAFLDGLDKVRSIEWGLSYLWDVRFVNPNPPSPFSEWFPASSIEEDIFSIESYTFDARGGQYSVPLRRGKQKKISLSFYDDVNNTLLNWFDVWVNDTILSRNSSVVAPLESAVRQIDVIRLNAAKETVGKMRSYWVYPEGTMTFSGSSESEARSFTMELVIVASIGNLPIT